MSNTYWMVERSINGSAHWWTRPPLNHEHWDSPHRWTTESALAVHFPKKEAAELIAESDMCECFATEHMDIGGKQLEDELYMVRADKSQTLMEAEKAMAQIREATAKIVKERDEARAEAAALRVALRSVVRQNISFRWDGEKQCHVPWIMVEFAEVPSGDPNTAQGWRDRDAFAAAIEARKEGV